ncbi:circularly permuted type 2 ATP-grasp protein [Reichenbachiella agarivorans]|uniref:Circularly permuted type 2 ATP-grasp protein n=1 Tax=Reichenbachiella agarivorans TaxID=2979464 RepID=A0ABY6CLT0_9BACT|nr:circularly permuted type 2 ATP-grasp protein [Reichenbachiella agarivorans]UXP31457.1 circularly permuted type 2 ATP-grasp protein [Reichenbachiella agarivorans]
MIESYLVDRMFSNTRFLDELANSEGQVTPQWRKLAHFYERMGAQRMEQFHEDVSRQLRENGVTYNVYGDPDGMNRPWNLDPVPMVFNSEDWAVIEKGLIQRSTLLNYILKDIYGSRSLIKDGHLPFELIYNHKGFLRHADKIQFDAEQQLIQYSADLARGPDGQMWVLHDRTDAPSGAGYTFENRAAMTRVFPDQLRENQVRKISSYYQTLKNTLVHLSSKNNDNPRIVYLSPGPTNETYFEHAYLSSLMGFTLAIGEDLTVSDGYVWLKTIKGLEKVDVIIRRVDDVFCDPLEFRSDSHLGVVGLMEAVRQQKVLVINPLGCRILENPGLMAFLPKLCRHILGEELILNSVATWWCGQEPAKTYVLEHFDSLIIRMIYRDGGNKSVYGGNLNAEEKTKLIAKINKSPYLYVGQEMVDFSTTPSWINKNLEARNAVFRSYIVADSENNRYAVMPGGLSRSSPEKGVFMVSNQTGGISKDTWVLGKAADAQTTVPKAKTRHQSMEVTVLPSRTGEHLFWLGRYMERSAFTVRLMRMALQTYNESDEDIRTSEDIVLTTLLKSLTRLTGTLPGFTKKEVLANADQELLALALDVNKVGSLAQAIQSFLTNGYAVRDRLSLDTWRILDSISAELTRMRQQDATLTEVYHGLDNMVIKMMAFYGLNIDNMTREATWHLLNVGRFIESSTNTCTVLMSMLTNSFNDEVDKALMEDTLRCNESLVTYRYKYRSNLELHGVLNLLIVNEENPRSLIYQILKIDKHLSSLPALVEGRQLSPARKKLLEAVTMIKLCDIDSLCTVTTGSRKSHQNLKEFLKELIALLNEISVFVSEDYFSHTGSRYSMIQSSILPEI